MKSDGNSNDTSDDLLELHYVPLDTVVLWDANPKRHDLDSLRQSIKDRGFKDPPKYEPLLNDGNGGIVEGNGRTTVLVSMRDNDEQPPRGIATLSNGQWAVPILFGVDAVSRAEAEAYGIDHNNLTLMGGGLRDEDLLQIWDEERLMSLVASMSDERGLIVSFKGDSLDALLQGPSFTPGSSEDQPSLDKKKVGVSCPECRGMKVVCCECGHEYDLA